MARSARSASAAASKGDDEEADNCSGGRAGAGAVFSHRRYDQLRADGDEDSADLVEQAALRDREWDAWKEDNPRGSGNKMGKRF